MPESEPDEGNKFQVQRRSLPAGSHLGRRRGPNYLQLAIALEARIHLFDYMVPVVKYLFSIVVAPLIGFAWARNEPGKRLRLSWSLREFMAVT